MKGVVLIEIVLFFPHPLPSCSCIVSAENPSTQILLAIANPAHIVSARFVTDKH